MKHMAVRQELNIAYLKDHVEGEAVAGFLEHGGGFELGGRKRGDEAGVGEAG